MGSGTGESSLSIVPFTRAACTPPGHALLLQSDLSLPMFVAIASSGDGKFSKVNHPWQEVNPIPIGIFPIPTANRLPLKKHTSKKGPYKAEKDLGVRRDHM